MLRTMVARWFSFGRRSRDDSSRGRRRRDESRRQK
jgi:hypothetical protein